MTYQSCDQSYDISHDLLSFRVESRQSCDSHMILYKQGTSITHTWINNGV